MKNLFKLTIKVIAVVLVFFIGYGIYFYFKPMAEITGQSPDYTLTDTLLLADFNASPEKAQDKYKNKILEITGHLKKTEIQDDANIVIFDNGGASIIVATCVASEKNKVIKIILRAKKFFFKEWYLNVSKIKKAGMLRSAEFSTIPVLKSLSLSELKRSPIKAIS